MMPLAAAGTPMGTVQTEHLPGRAWAGGSSELG
jgi:hypothetical protein